MNQLPLLINLSSNKSDVSDFFKDVYDVVDSYFFRVREFPKIKARFASHFVKDQDWMAISGESLKANPELFSYLMMAAPRWNPHALIVAGPIIEVNKHLEINFEKLNQSSSNWSLAIHSFPENKLVFNRSSHQSPCGGLGLYLNPGKYKLVMRVYEPGQNLKSPEMLVDHAVFMGSQEIKHDNNAFYSNTHIDQYNYFKRLHCFPVCLLKYQRWIGAERIKKHFLPVADKDTHFEFGYLHQDQNLSIKFDQVDFSKNKVYFCFYSEASFPLYWSEVKESSFNFSYKRSSGFYVVRVI